MTQVQVLEATETVEPLAPAEVDPPARANGVETMAEIDQRIRKTFSVLTQVAGGIIQGHIRAAIVSGAPGCGKTYTLERELSNAAATDDVKYRIVKGTMSALGLYKELWETRESGHVLMMDDTDEIFGDLPALNLLKAALDTGKTRRINWLKESRVLEAEGIDRSFDFEGAVVFITNTDFVRKIASGSGRSQHYNALLTRALYVDLGIHSKREVMVRIGQVVFSNEFLSNNDLTRTEAQEMVTWLSDNLERVRVLSIRTIIQLTNMVKTTGSWKDMAEVLMLTKPIY